MEKIGDTHFEDTPWEQVTTQLQEPDEPYRPPDGTLLLQSFGTLTT